MKHKPLSCALMAVWSLCFILLCVIFSIEFWSYQKPFFYQQYASYGAAQTIDVTDDALESVTTVLVDYLKGTREDLNVDTLRGSNSQPFFNQREIDHMVDVRILFDFMRGLKLALLLGVGLLPLLWYLGKPAAQALLLHAKAYLCTLGIVVLVLGAVAALFAINFSAAWSFAHTLVFTNDLWLLDPATDMLINLVPLPFFIAICTRIVLTLLALLGLLAVVCASVLLRGRKKRTNGAAL